MPNPFENRAEEYDQWYDSPKGRQIFEAEVKCLRHVCPQCQGRWLEVGVGTGRFADEMGIADGIDPSAGMLELAAKRGIATYLGSAEALPFDACTFEGVLIAFTLCFIESAQKALSECRRVLRADGQLLVGMVPADSSWGKSYQQKKEQGHPIYSHAHFLTTAEVISFAERAGFELQDSACTLLCSPDESPKSSPVMHLGISEQAGFAALLFSKQTG